MRKYMELIEKCGYVPKGTPGHGSGGWLGVNMPDPKLSANDTQILRIGLEAGIAMGQIKPGGLQERQGDLVRTLSSDLNSASAARDFTEGMYQIPLDMENGKRTGSRDFVIAVSTARNADGSKKYSLDVELNSHVTRVLFEPNRVEKGMKPVATGVEYIKGKQVYKASPAASGKSSQKLDVRTANAKKEVILSAGAFNTPQILKLSGVGPKEELAKFKIPLQADMPGVGTNLQDHFEIGVTHETDKPFVVTSQCKFEGAGDLTDPCFQLWKNNLTGPLASSNGFPFALLKKSSVAPTNEPDIFIFGGATKFRGYYRGYSKESYAHNYWTWVVLRAHTDNRAGTVKLLSADPLDPPEINFHYFNDGDTAKGEDERDIQAMSEAIELARRASNGGPGVVPSAKSPLAREIIPGPKVNGKQALAQYIKEESWSHHASCTCPIGADGDRMAVLDSEFRVRGVVGLRVVDASVFPRIPGYFVVLPTYLIGEKAADVISSGTRR
jgi:choline dehydrogenase